MAYTENDPDGCVCTANITLHKSGGIGTVNNNYHREIVGGVVGLCTADKVSNLKYKGKINSNGSSPQAYAGGILGYVYDGSVELENCKVGGSVRSTNSGGAALMCWHASGKEVTYTFTNCSIEKGAMVYATSKNPETIEGDSDVTVVRCLGNASGAATIDNDVLPSVVESID